ncbi:MAG: hypothetical protein ACFFEK_17500, partial [Candidatus Thorarchaeota archaeon]
MPIVFLESPDDDTLGKLTIVYKVYEERSESDWNESADSLTYYVSSNSMKAVLKTRYYFGYPLAADVETWDYYESVTLGTHTALIVGTSDAYGYDCWDCEINNQTF